MPAAPRHRTANNPIVFTGIFLMFAPIGVLMMMVQSPPPGWAIALVSGRFAGIISLGWAFSFMTRRFWILIPVNIFSIFGASPLFSPADPPFPRRREPL